jgi:hypothetical protein
MSDLLLKLQETGQRVEQMQHVQERQVNNDDAGEFNRAVWYDKLLKLFRVSPSHSGSGSRSNMGRHQRSHLLSSRNSP